MRCWVGRKLICLQRTDQQMLRVFSCVRMLAILHQQQTLPAEPSGFEAHWRRLYLENNVVSDKPILTCQPESRLLLVISLIKINQDIKSWADLGKNSVGWSPERILSVWSDIDWTSHSGFNSSWHGIIMPIEGHKFSLVQIEIVNQLKRPAINSHLQYSNIICRSSNTFLRILIAPKQVEDKLSPGSVSGVVML